MSKLLDVEAQALKDSFHNLVNRIVGKENVGTIFFLRGGTGSGKSTRVIRGCYDRLLKGKKEYIGYQRIIMVLGNNSLLSSLKEHNDLLLKKGVICYGLNKFSVFGSPKSYVKSAVITGDTLDVPFGFLIMYTNPQSLMLMLRHDNAMLERTLVFFDEFHGLTVEQTLTFAAIMQPGVFEGMKDSAGNETSLFYHNKMSVVLSTAVMETVERYFSCLNNIWVKNVVDIETLKSKKTKRGKLCKKIIRLKLQVSEEINYCKRIRRFFLDSEKVKDILKGREFDKNSEFREGGKVLKKEVINDVIYDLILDWVKKIADREYFLDGGDLLVFMESIKDVDVMATRIRSLLQDLRATEEYDHVRVVAADFSTKFDEQFGGKKGMWATDRDVKTFVDGFIEDSELPHFAVLRCHSKNRVDIKPTTRDMPTRPLHKIILTTPIYELGLTPTNAVSVIDCCTKVFKEFSMHLGGDTFLLKMYHLNNHIERYGRIGRSVHSKKFGFQEYTMLMLKEDTLSLQDSFVPDINIADPRLVIHALMTNDQINPRKVIEFCCSGPAPMSEEDYWVEMIEDFQDGGYTPKPYLFNTHSFSTLMMLEESAEMMKIGGKMNTFRKKEKRENNNVMMDSGEGKRKKGVRRGGGRGRGFVNERRGGRGRGGGRARGGYYQRGRGGRTRGRGRGMRRGNK